MQIDINADMGEGFGQWALGDDTGLLRIVSSANIACGFHAGDPDVMAASMRQAARAGVAIGAHPGLPDLQGFGRRRMAMSGDELFNLCAYQVGAAAAMARSAGASLAHVKLHGALSNMAAENPQIAAACYAGALAAVPGLRITAQAATAMETAAQDLGADWVGEIFADRAYAEDGTLAPRHQPGAVLHDPAVATKRVLAMLRAGAVITAAGNHIPARIGTICVHGDTPAATGMARALREGLEQAGYRVTAPAC